MSGSDQLMGVFFIRGSNIYHQDTQLGVLKIISVLTKMNRFVDNHN